MVNNIATQVQHIKLKIPDVDPVTPDEIKQIILHRKKRKAPGQDGINNTIIKNLNDQTIEKLTDTINSIYKFCHSPNSWKNSQVILIYKSGKSIKDPTSYRPINLLTGQQNSRKNNPLQAKQLH